jgi:hypothetical protein
MATALRMLGQFDEAISVYKCDPLQCNRHHRAHRLAVILYIYIIVLIASQ